MLSSTSFCDELAGRLALSPAEEEFFRGAGVRSFDGAHTLLLASLSPEARDLSWSPADRRYVLAKDLTPLLSNSYRAAVDEWASAERHPAGAAAPSAAARYVTVPTRTASLLDQPGVAFRLTMDHATPLNQLPALDLLGHRHSHWQIENQRPRQTCVAFAVAACIELMRAGQGTEFTPLSPQFLYWHIRTHPWPGSMPPGWAEGATKLGFARQVLAESGICTLALCEYPRQLPPHTPIEGPTPTAPAETEARGRITSGCYLDAPDPDNRPANVAKRIYDLLRQGRPVAIAVPVFRLIPGNQATTFDSPQTLAKGEVSDPPPGATPSSGHAVCVIGFQPDAAGGWFIFRNSVGLNFAKHLDPMDTTAPFVPASGYGAISARYVENYCWELFSPKSI